MNSNQNIIHNSVFNFEYENKASATRCNILIESIFNSHILPELEAAISKTIPDGILVELAKLEINIGRINEREISVNLASRIRTSLENTLQDKITIKNNLLSGSTAYKEQINDNYLIRSIEVYLQKGYFPFGMDETLKIDDLIKIAIEQNSRELIGIIKKLSHKDHAIRRIVYGFSTKTFDLILYLLAPEDSHWIIDLRKMFLYTKQKKNLSQFTGDEFLRTINYFILCYLLNETNSGFDKKKFSVSIFKELSRVSKLNFGQMLLTLKKYTGNADTIRILNETLTDLVADKKKTLSEDKNREFDILSLIELLNERSIESKSYNRQILKDEIIQAINDKKKRKLLIERINTTGINLILELFTTNDNNILFNLITTFANKLAEFRGEGISGVKMLSVNSIVLFTVIYLNENAIRLLNKEEYILFLIYTAGLNDIKTINTAAFKSFISEQENIDIKKIQSIIEDERQHPEISGIQKLISKSLNPTHSEVNTHPDGTSVYFSIYSRKIVGYYLNSGQLPETFFDLSWHDLQTLFSNLIHQKDDFLAAQIRKHNDSESLITRLNALIGNQPFDALKVYLIHFFQDEYTILSEIMLEIKQLFTIRKASHINTQVFSNELFITSLVRSKGGSLSGIFVFSLLEKLNYELAKVLPDSELLFHHLFSKSGSITETNHLQNKISWSAEFKKAISIDFKHLVNRLHFSEFRLQPTVEELRNLIQKFAGYYQADQNAFLDILQRNRAELRQVFSLLKLYLPVNQWKQIEKTLLSKIEFKSEIERFNQDSDSAFKIIFNPKMDLVKTFENINASETQKLKAFWLIIKSDEGLIEKFISQSKDFQLHPNLIIGDRKIQSYIQQLISFSPDNLSGRIDRKFWKSVVLSFGIQIFLEEKKIASNAFSNAFMNHLIQKLKAINEVDLFYPILDKMYSSGSKELQELVELRHSSKDLKYRVFVNDETDNKRSSVKINQCFSVLKFYTQHEFFPWWAKQSSFPEITAEFYNISRLYPNTFEEIFLQLEKEEHIFEQLIQKLSHSIITDFDVIIKSHLKLKEVWNQILQKGRQEAKVDLGNKNEPDKPNSLFKEIYFSDEEELIRRLKFDDSQIEGQLKQYLLLSPYFIFRNISPAQWRQTIYDFSLDFNRHEKKNVINEFHSYFLNYLKKKYSGLNWAETFTSVYQRVKSSESKNSVVIPQAMLQLITIETSSQTTNKEIENEVNKHLSSDDEGVEVKVYNAGLILFWPFLTRLFEHLALVKNGAFINPESMNRAVYLLQYLAYYDIDFPEYKLVLNKLLVGMQSHDHLTPFITLTDDEKESALSLLKGLINNWEQVKNSSPEGIQETFLQREGILRFGKDKVTLIVEEKGVDILLHSVPWNISLIKLPWMQMPIFVEWI
jgi:hypothetical protein